MPQTQRSSRCIVIVDGEHYPPVVTAALDALAASGIDVVAAVLIGGNEKLPEGGVGSFGDVPVRTGPDPLVALDAALAEFGPGTVIDYSDEPVLDYRARHRLAALALYRGVSYKGADFAFTPPPMPGLCRMPSVAVIGTGKRTGKTAVSAFAARTLHAAGRRPVVVAMGRGGPEEPEVIAGDEVDMTPQELVALADEGRHAASDYIEDAILARVPTVGCRRCGGGLAGAVGMSNVAAGVEIANDLGDIMLLEGSGSSLPPVRADATVLVMPASVPIENLAGYMGPYRLLLADCVVVTMCEYPFGSPSQISGITSQLRDAFRAPRRGEAEREEIRVVRTVFRPAPTKPVEGLRAFVVTTAPEAAGDSITQFLEEEHGCRVAGVSHSLSDRKRLQEDLRGAEGKEAEVLLCEIKAAGIDVATRWALARGIEVVYMDNVPIGLDGDDPAALVEWTAELAGERYDRG